MSPALPLGGSRFKLRVEPQKRTLGDFLLQLLRQRVKKARRLQKTAQVRAPVCDPLSLHNACVPLALRASTAQLLRWCTSMIAEWLDSCAEVRERGAVVQPLVAVLVTLTPVPPTHDPAGH